MTDEFFIVEHPKDEFFIVEHPKGKILHWTRYAVPDETGVNYTIIDKSTIKTDIERGYRPVWALQYPELHTEAMKKNSELFLQHEGYILCEKDLPKPYTRWELFKAFIKGKI